MLVPTRARAAALAARLEVALQIGYEELFVLTPSALAGLVSARRRERELSHLTRS